MSKRKIEEKQVNQVALLLIDVQEPFWSGSPIIREANPSFKENIIKLLTWARSIGLHIVHIRAEYNKSISPWLSPFLELNPDKKVNETVLASSVESFAAELPGEKVVAKHTFDGFLNTGLTEYLHELGVKDLIVGGLVTTACVLTTCLGGFGRGFNIAILEDCTGDRTQEKTQSTLNIYCGYIFQRTNLKEVQSVVDKWNSRGTKSLKTDSGSVVDQKTFQESGIIPDVIDQFVPSIALNITYGSHSVNYGTELSPAVAKSAPSVSWTADKSLFYTLIMIDPDAPSRKTPKFRNWRHWIITNLTQSSSDPKAHTCASYAGPTPPAGSGFHRYVFLLFSHTEKKEIQVRSSAKSFDVREFVKTHQLGVPLGVNWFLAKTD